MPSQTARPAPLIGGTTRSENGVGRTSDQAGGQISGQGSTSATQPSNLEDLRRRRRELKEDGGKRTVIIEPGGRRIIRNEDRIVIGHNEMLRFQRVDRNIRREQRRDGNTVFILARTGGVEIISVVDRDRRLLRRYRRYPDGREVILIDNTDYWRGHRSGFYGVPMVRLGPVVLSVPRRDYVVEYRDASDERIYEILSAPPVERLERVYSLEEIRYSHSLRERLRRIDLDVLNFESGSWTVDSAQLPRLERIARVMRRLIDRRPEEVFLIEGHTDSVGTTEDNLTLSDRRAEQVAIVLSDRFDVPPENMVTQGYGESFLKIQTSAAEPANRRVSVRRITPLMARR